MFCYRRPARPTRTRTLQERLVRRNRLGSMAKTRAGAFLFALVVYAIYRSTFAIVVWTADGRTCERYGRSAAQSRITVRTLEALTFGGKHPKKRVRFAYTSLNLWGNHSKHCSVPETKRNRGWGDRTVGVHDAAPV